MANEIRDQANEEFRAFETDGVPSSGAHKPSKAGIRRIFSTINDKVETQDARIGSAETGISVLQSSLADESLRIDGIENAAIAGYRFYATKAALDADTGQPDGTRAVVDQDTTSGNNGVYARQSGSWVRIGDYALDVVAGVASVVGEVATEVYGPTIRTIGFSEIQTDTTQANGNRVRAAVEPLTVDGIVRRFRAYARIGGTHLFIRRYLKSGTLLSRVGDEYRAMLDAGPNDIIMEFPVYAGEHLGFFTAYHNLGYATSGTAPNGGWHFANGDIDPFTANSPETQPLQVGFDIEPVQTVPRNSRIVDLERQVRDLTNAMRSPAAKRLKRILDTEGVNVGYLFDEEDGAFLDLSKNGLHITQDEYSPPRVTEGILFPGDKSFSLPNINIKTIVACHYWPDPIPQTGRLISSGGIGHDDAAIAFANVDNVSIIGMDAVWVDLEPGSTTSSYATRGAWHTVSYQIATPTIRRVRIGRDHRDLVTRICEGVKLVALLAFSRDLTEGELEEVNAAIAEIAAGRGVALPITERPAILNGVVAPNAPSFITLPSPYTTLQDRMTHPSVIDMEAETGQAGAKWNGYRYWFAGTPFPPDTNENPCIFASDDGDNWIVPPGVVNPIEAKPDGSSFNSDTDMVLDPDGVTMHLVWRPFIITTGQPNVAQIVHSSSTDGWVTRTPNALLLEEAEADDNLLSPTLFYDDRVSKWRLYSVKKGSPSPNRMLLREADAADGPFGPPIECMMPAFYPQTRDTSSSRGPWHIQVRRDDRVGGYICFASTTYNGEAVGAEDAHVLTSLDGFRWFVPDAPLMVKGAAGAWDDGGMYRLTGVRTEDGYDVFYSAVKAPTTNGAHRVGRTSFSLPG